MDCIRFDHPILGIFVLMSAAIAFFVSLLNRNARETKEVQQLSDRKTGKQNSSICPICLEICEETRSTFTLECGHRYCASCIRQHVRTCISLRKVQSHELTCPISTCHNPIGEKIIAELLKSRNDIRTWRKYIDFLNDDYVTDQIAKGLFFRCPNGNCGNVFEYTAPCSIFQWIRSGRVIQCNACKQSMCVGCPAVPGTPIGPTHEPFTCSEYKQQLHYNSRQRSIHDTWVQRKNSLTDASLQYFIRNSHKMRLCPRCKMAIEKNGGCEVMFCTNCRSEFKWDR